MESKYQRKKALLKEDNTIYIEESIFKDIASGDKAAFTDLYTASSKAIYAYILTYVKNTEDAKDLMHDTYVKVREAAGIYEPYGKPMAWLFTIARNLALMKLRKETAHPETELEETLSSFDNIEKQVENHILLKEALSVLSKDDCQIVLLHAISGMKHREIAEFMGISLTSTLNRYNRALKKIRKQMGGDYNE